MHRPYLLLQNSVFYLEHKKLSTNKEFILFSRIKKAISMSNCVPLLKQERITMQIKNDKKNIFAPKITTKKIVLTYLLLSILLFVFGDKLIFSLSMNNSTLFTLQSAKNCLLILLSAAALYYLLNLHTKTFLQVSHELAAENLALTTENRELTRQSASQKHSFLSALPDALFHLDKHGLLLDFFIPENVGFPRKFAFDETARGQHISAFFSAATVEKNLAIIQKVLAERRPQCLECSYHEGDIITHWEARYTLYCEQEILVFVRNITTQQQAIEKIKQLSIHDKMTGLTNRTYFELQLDRLEDTLNFPVGVIVCDAEYLKLVNDSASWEKGLLSAVTLLKQSFTGAVSISRIGNSQFVIFYKNTSQPQVEAAVNTLHKNTVAYNKNNPANPLGLSLGIAISAKPDSKIQELFHQADYAMYCDKIDHSKEIRELFLQAILYTLRTHEPSAYNHFANMQQLIEKFAKACQLSAQSIQELKWLATFHDIGKIGVPSYILNKPEHLTPEELLEIRKHSSIGYRIARITPSLMPIADLINKHHEWWNGQGYPLGLKEEQIPLECRILAIVEAFDAMTSDHPYRAARPASAALEEIQRCAGTQFDPDLAEKFLELMQKEAPG
jgi:diguanylate cyclase (GGDEF)-like protein